MKKIISQYLNINEDRFYLKSTIFFFILWLFTKSFLRRIIRDTVFASSWVVGVAPNFFAGITLVFWQTYGTRTKPFTSFLCAVSVLAFSEFIQLFIPTQYADWNDIFASITGAALAAFFSFKKTKQIIKNEKGFEYESFSAEDRKD